MNTNDDYVEYWKKFNKEGYQKNISKRKLLHNNSKELVKICNDFNILKDNIDIFEIGCGCSRNLYYLWKNNNKVNISGNDLIKEECFKYMEEDIKSVINFKEIDTLRMVEKNKLSPDLFISSDHLMHLEPETSKKVLKEVIEEWEPLYLLLRESQIDRLNRGVKKFRVDYECVKDKYDILYEKVSEGDSSYIIVLGKLKND